MKTSPRNRLPVIAITLIVLSTCCSVFALATPAQSWNWPRPMAKANTSPAATVYMWSRDGNGYLCMTGYSIADGSVVSQLQLPAGDGGYGPFTTDSLGQLYIPVGSQGNPYFNQILVYAAHANGNDSPIRTIDLPAAWVHVTNIGVDPLGYVYVVSTLYGTGNSYIVQIEVYSPTANGLTKPVRTLQLRNILLPVEGIAADAAGNIYLAAYLKTNTFSGWAVAVYSGTARGVIPPSWSIRERLLFRWLRWSQSKGRTDSRARWQPLRYDS